MVGYDTVSPRSPSELSDQDCGVIDLIMLTEANCEWSHLCKRIAFVATATGGVRPIGLLLAIVRVQRTLRRIEAKVWEAPSEEQGSASSGVSGAARLE